MDIGERIRELRLAKNLTLEELADRCELTKGFLSQLENNMNTPSIQTLEDITEVLGVSMSKFFQESKANKVVYKKEDYFEDEKAYVKRTWLVSNAQDKMMEPILLTLQPDGQSEEIANHAGEEFGYVLKGTVTLQIYNGPSYTIAKGNTFYLNGEKRHWLVNKGKYECELIWVMTPPNF